MVALTGMVRAMAGRWAIFAFGEWDRHPKREPDGFLQVKLWRALRLAAQRPDDRRNAGDQRGEGQQKWGIENKHNTTPSAFLVPYLQ